MTDNFPKMYGLSQLQWQEASRLFKTTFGEETYTKAHPGEIRAFWSQKENQQDQKRRASQRRAPLRRQLKKEKLPEPPPKQTIKHAMEGVKYE